MGDIQALLKAAQADFKMKAYSAASEKAWLVLKSEPLNSVAWLLLGMVALESKNYQEAIGYLEKANESKPKAIIFFNLGVAYRRLSQLKDAIQSYEACLNLDPTMVQALSNLGHLYRLTGQSDKALLCYKKCLDIDPKNANAHYNAGVLYHMAQNLDNALKEYRHAIKFEPENAKAYANIGTIFSQLRKYKESVPYYKKAIEYDASLFDAYNNCGAALIELERLEEADGYLRKALKLKPTSCGTLRNITVCKTYTDLKDGDLLYIQKMLEYPKITQLDKCHLYFALGKIYRDCKSFDLSFKMYTLGNEIQSKEHPFHIFGLHEYVRNISKVFSKEFINHHQNLAKTSIQPIVIVGTPCSGKTLLESLLSTHPEIAGKGEMGLSEFAYHSETSKGIELFPEWVEKFDAASASRLIEAYENKMLDDTPRKVYSIDEMPGNIFYLGLFFVLYPNCKVILITRNLMDTGLCMYFKYYVNKHYYASHLKNIGRYFRLFASLLDHWKNILPSPMIEVKYEDLVCDQARTMAQVTERLKLKPFEFHTNHLNSSEIGLFEHYKKYVTPLLEGLSYEPDDEKTRIQEILEEASDRHQRREFDKAHHLYDYCLEIDSNNPVANQLLGVLEFEQGNSEKAIELIEKAIKKQPDYPQAHSNLAYILERSHRSEEAVAHQKEAERILTAGLKQREPLLSKEDQEILQSAFNRQYPTLQAQDNKILYQGQTDHINKTLEVLIMSKQVEIHSKNEISTLLLQYSNLVESIFKDSTNDSRILEVGCSGLVFKRYSKDRKRVYYWGLDIDDAKLQKALFERSPTTELYPKAYVLQDYDQGLPFKDNFFEIVISSDLIQHLPVQMGMKILYEMTRVLKPNGQLILSTVYEPSKKTLMAGLAFNKVKNLILNKGFALEGEFGISSEFSVLKAQLNPEHQKLFKELSLYHSDETLSAMFSPFYPQISSQRIFIFIKK